MAFEEHSDYVTPADNATLWRYMDFTKFIDLLSSNALWLQRLDLLDDSREGHFTNRERDRLSKYSDGRETSAATNRPFSFVNCWQQSDRERMLMWVLYGAAGRGIAINTTVGQIKAAIRRL